ncbi:MAG TPA: thioredoxin domain-containing protein [Steroidobacteraceae bacterium]|nr:thioredoxin domain-containing protein [Steroidobacteraceae bacterium]
MRAYATLIIALLLASGGCTAAPATEATADAAPTQPFNVLGREDAPVTIIEFTDLQCPYCARFATQAFPQLRRNYIDTGLVRFASRDLPLPMHAYAVPAAVAARCAGEQGRFWEFREALFAAQATLGPETYVEQARKHGLDLEAFAACRRDGRQAANVRADLDLARANGITATPSLIVGRLVDGQFQGETIEGAKPYAVIAAKIDALLEAAR